MKHKICSLLIVAVVFVVGCQSKEKGETSSGKTKAPRGWAASMQGVAQDVYQLIPYIYDEKAYGSSNHKKTIQQHLDRLSGDAHHISAEMGKPFLGQDPLLEFSLTNLKSDLGRAAQSFREGHTEYSRSLVKTSVGHCFRCHSVVQVGSKAPWKIEELKGLQLAPREKMDLLVAARENIEALKFSEEYLKNTEALQAQPYEYGEVLRKYVSLATRWTQNSPRALATLEEVEQQKALPEYLKSQVGSWVRSLKEYENKPQKLAGVGGKSLIQNAKTSIQKARGAGEFAADNAGDVEYLRATVYLHEALRRKLSDQDQAQAFEMLGQAYEVLNELGAWGLHETYYEQCIRRVPATLQAQRCYRRLEASVYFGYSGSGGTHIPSYERERLKELKGLSQALRK